MRAILALSLAVAACDSYGPDLGEQPFRCGTAEPLCPDGYTCVEHTPGRRVCERGGDVPDAGTADAALPACADRLEPNDSRQLATLTPVPELAPAYDMRDLSTCPAGDRDFFQFSVDSADARLRVTASSGGPTLSLRILNEAGTLVASGRAVAAGVVELRMPGDVITAPLAPGRYLAEIASMADVEATYRLEIKTCSGAPSCLD